MRARTSIYVFLLWRKEPIIADLFWRLWLCVTDWAISPSMCNEKLHRLFNSGSERVLTGQQQQQLCRRQLQQHACDFTGKRLWRQT